jgi:hypothetical protein
MRGKIAWAVVWPNGEILSRNPGVPAIFFTHEDALRWKRNSHYETPKVVQMRQRERKGEAAQPAGELRWTEREREVLAELAKKSDVSEFVILRQGLRVQQLLIEGTHKLVEVVAALQREGK